MLDLKDRPEISEGEAYINKLEIEQIYVSKRQEELQKTITSLKALPAILACFSLDHWFCIFRLLNNNKDILNARHVCSAWFRSVEKYKQLIFVTDTNIIAKMRQMKIEKHILPFHIFSYKTDEYLVSQLMQFILAETRTQLVVSIFTTLKAKYSHEITFMRHIDGIYKYELNDTVSWAGIFGFKVSLQVTVAPFITSFTMKQVDLSLIKGLKVCLFLPRVKTRGKHQFYFEINT